MIKRLLATRQADSAQGSFACLWLPEPGTFEDLPHPVRVEVASLARLSRQPAAAQYGSAGVYRFDDPEPDRPKAFGTCYTASAVDGALAESVFDECWRLAADSYEVPTAELTARSVVRFACQGRRTLALADLTRAALKSLGINNFTKLLFNARPEGGHRIMGGGIVGTHAGDMIGEGA